MFKKREIPVYLFTGFLDGGKTSFLKQTMDEGQFKDGLKTLYLVMEEGEVEIDEERLASNKFFVRTVEDEDELTEALLAKFDKEVGPGRVIIEANGMWDIQELFDAMPEHWMIAEVVTPVDSTTFEMYLNNMKMMMTNQFLYSDLVLFNRCGDEYDRAMFKRMVRAVNRRAQILYESPDGKVEDNVPEEMPFDIDAPIVQIGDEDFGIFYIDILDYLSKYVGKTLSFKAIAYHPKEMKSADMFVVGRNAMTCCAEDISLVGFPCRYDKAAEIKNDEWVKVTVKVQTAMNRKTNEPMPFLEAISVEKTEPAEEDVVNFY